MSVLCSTTCCPAATSAPPASYWQCTDVTRQIGAKHFILIDCDYQFTDITDSAEWVQAQADGHVQCSPPGRLVINTPDQTLIEDFDGCAREYVADVSYNIDFTTYQTADDLSDVEYWKNVFANSSRFKLILVDCNSIFTLDDNYVNGVAPVPTVAGESPGLDFSITVIPHEAAGEGRLTLWTTQFKIKKNGPLCKTLLPGVSSAVCCS